jgi:transposase
MELGKPSGVIHPRVARVGPERFGIVAVDCAKTRSKWMLTNFYGRVLLPPVEVEHTAGGFRAALASLEQARQAQNLAELIVVVERTGNYHLPAARAFRQAGYEVRVLHPFATKHYRQPAHPGDKTDDHDLAAIAQATVGGFALLEKPLGEPYRRLRLLVRHRRDLVQKSAAVQCQLREHLHLALPGYAALFDPFWNFPLPMAIARGVGSPAEVRRLGAAGLSLLLKSQAIRHHAKSVDKVAAWAEQAVEPGADGAWQAPIIADLDDDRRAKIRQIRALEQEFAPLLAATPYVLLLRIPGINVVSAAEFAAEMGPIADYANPNAITGRAGLFHARYQSDAVDRKGPLVRRGNRRLRSALLLIADNLLRINRHFRGCGEVWKRQNRNRRWQHVRVATHFSRLAFTLVGGRVSLAHPCCQEPAAVLDKLVAFQLTHDSSPETLRTTLLAALEQLPHDARQGELPALRKRLPPTVHVRRGPQPIGEILREIVAKLAVMAVQSQEPPASAAAREREASS